ncbi:MAG: sigma-54-dependent Fis family transcriptional regulator [Deltaproteobacteria bacterium]|nr:sigma-54-dependent Fis family transcriptional regulator [Deltaproteobacteria bacterium]
MKKVMVIDDDEKVIIDIAAVLEKEGYTVATFTSAPNALETLDALRDIDLVLTDIRMPVIDGHEILKRVLARSRPVPVIVLTGFADVDTAVNVMKAGASDFLCKPISGKELVVRIKKVLEKQELAEEVVSLRKRLETAETFHSIVGKSKKMMEVYELINSIASTDTTVLVRGETGTGKELVARAIHLASERKGDPFVPISCTAIQHTLLESELFGHEKGAFTGAHALKTGKLESAGKGTVFLDEIGDTSPDIQAKLLRVLQEKEFERVGGIRQLKLDARIITATNRNLEQLVHESRFREDLYYRLNVVQVDLPPLREREGDILALANSFLDFFKKRYDKTIEGFSPSAVEQLLGHSWPGNVRELRNAIERTVLTNPRRWIDRVSRLESAGGLPEAFKDLPGRLNYLKAKDTVSQELEKTYLIQYMRQEKGQINRVAELMGVSTRTVSRQLEKYGLDKMVFKEKKATPPL